MSKRNAMPGLRLKGDVWHIEKRCKHAKDGWLRESTGTASRIEAEEYLIQRLASVKQEQIDDLKRYIPLRKPLYAILRI